MTKSPPAPPADAGPRIKFSQWGRSEIQRPLTTHLGHSLGLDAYLNEITFRLNRREMDKGQLHQALLGQIEGPMPWKVLTA